MALIQIRNVPEDTHRKLKERAAREGVTLSDLALAELERSLQRPTRREVLDRIAALPSREYGNETPAAAIRSERDAELAHRIVECTSPNTTPDSPRTR